ncbi:hypothetical protein HETIRDRAFT_102232 [Heterobasidion irregulare TC 32-1]|uniref:Uncharacterized protein n=1 Tax=Heterobasidion irregulare (strain TC 32-1) TaxID=747525 RepID=W4K823_HETIT|nr:uncharacterized protein HETIRDRAFT_102232 [Heterobasidion irregulare TC 32-1]ETW81216.1 hypothetical protein HETIRDRAFT_102232 [Heterobasidion irregulare TC 32-1]
MTYGAAKITRIPSRRVPYRGEQDGGENRASLRGKSDLEDPEGGARTAQRTVREQGRWPRSEPSRRGQPGLAVSCQNWQHKYLDGAPPPEPDWIHSRARVQRRRRERSAQRIWQRKSLDHAPSPSPLTPSGDLLVYRAHEHDRSVDAKIDSGGARISTVVLIDTTA